MTINLATLDTAPRLLFAIPLHPLQGKRFQPTGFPGLGAATFRTSAGDCLLVESAQSMANWLEKTIWDDATNDVIEAAKGISHVKVTRPDGSFLTDTILESVENTGRLVIVDESNPRCSLASDIAGLAAQEVFGSLRAPIQQVTGPHTPVPFTDSLEDLFIPDAAKIAGAVKTATDWTR